MLEYSNTLSAKEYCELRSAVSWQPIIEEQAQSGLMAPISLLLVVMMITLSVVLESFGIKVILRIWLM